MLPRTTTSSRRETFQVQGAKCVKSEWVRGKQSHDKISPKSAVWLNGNDNKTSHSHHLFTHALSRWSCPDITRTSCELCERKLYPEYKVCLMTDWPHVWTEAGHCLENSRRANGRVDDVAQSVAASYSFLLACMFLSTLVLMWLMHPNTCSIDIYAKTVIVWDESSSLFCTPYPGTTPRLNQMVYFQ